MTTIEFHIKPKAANAFTVEVFQRGSSQPLATSAFEYDTSYLTQFEISQLEPDPRDPQGRLDRLTAFGRRLYDRVFSDDIKALWTRAKHESDFLVLCLRIDPQASGLETLPWETLHDGAEFLAAGAKTGVSRLPLDVPVRADLPAVPAPLKMLALMSSPLDLAEHERLQVEHEQEILLQAVNAPSGQGKLLLELEDEAKLPVLEGSLEGGCHILHYSGHGIGPESGGGLLLEDAQGNRRPTAVAEILQSLEKAEHTLRLVVISGCQTCKTLNARGFQDMARALLRRQIPAVTAMQFSISDAAGLIFAENLYPRLVEGQTLDIAVSAARRVLLHHEDVRIKSDAFAPVLLASSAEPLKTRVTKKATEAAQPKLDLAFHLPLPQLSYGFYGRRKEYRTIRDAITAKNHRAMIVHGIGGIGKTALISHVATRLREYFRDRVYAFDCTSAALAPETILLELHRYLENQAVSALGPLIGRSVPPDQLGGFIGQVLSQWPMLLIFDNFETHLAPQEGDRHKIADDNLAVFLKTLVKTTATGARFLFTTRYLFDLDARRIGDIQEVSLGDLSRPEALGLMQRLPCLAGASYENKLQAFDTFSGHPYALVTLDRHCAHRSLADVLKDAKDVHTELREFLAIELNYGRLSDRARQLLNRLAAFRKPVPHEAAEWVMGEKVEEEIVARQVFANPHLNPEMKKLGEEEFVRQHKAKMPEMRRAGNIGEPVAELVAWGLLTPQAEDGQIVAQAVHSLVRDFCRDKAGDETWKRNLSDAAAFYTNQAKLVPQSQKSLAIVWTDMEAFELLFEACHFEEAVHLLFQTSELLARRGFNVYLEWVHKRILPKVGPASQCHVLHGVGLLLNERARYDEALMKYAESLQIAETCNDASLMATLWHDMGIVFQNRGQYDDALRKFEDSLRASGELRNDSLAAKTLHHIGILYQNRGIYEAALAMYERSFRLLQQLGDLLNMGASLQSIATVHQLRKEYGPALTGYKAAQQLFESTGDQRNLAITLYQIGTLNIEAHEYKVAIANLQESLRIREEIDDRPGVARVRVAIGAILIEEEQYQQAFDHILPATLSLADMKTQGLEEAISNLAHLRSRWGIREFDKAWRGKTGAEVPEWLKGGPPAAGGEADGAGPVSS